MREISPGGQRRRVSDCPPKPAGSTGAGGLFYAANGGIRVFRARRFLAPQHRFIFTKNVALKTLRDTLLPKLISGEVRVALDT